jgi:hypothetical protein
MKAIGAIPVPLALTEVIPQLQSGGLDGMLAGMPILTAFKILRRGEIRDRPQLRADRQRQCDQ